MKTVIIIASGYEWICPNKDCEHCNKEIEVTENVTCKECDEQFEVEDYLHATK